jgi:flagellar hook protein FlgE
MANVLLTAVSGLRAHQQMLDVVGNNLANTNTTGFKAQSVQFSDLVYQTLKPATAAGSGSVGGTDPQQTGLGVQVAAINSNLQQGSLESTGNELDLALQGAGYFVANDGVENIFTRSGSFGVDSAGFLVDPSIGNRIQRFGAVGESSAAGPAFQTAGDNRIKIPYGTAIPGKATTTVGIQGNLSATALGPMPQTLTSTLPLLSGGTAATTSTTLNSLDDNSVDYVVGDKIRLQGVTAGGAAVDTTFAVGPTSTVGDLINAINANFSGSTASLDAAGNVVVKANVNGPSKLAVTISDAAGNTGVTSWNNHGLAVTTTGKNGDTATTGIQFFDSQGNAHTLTLVFQKQANNVWNMTGSVPAADGTLSDNLVSGITFNDDGSFRQVTGSGTGDAAMTVNLPNLATPQTINFTFGSNNGFDGLTQAGDESSAAATKQDGYTAGFLTTVSIAKDGIISGVFTNGRILDIAQLAVASFASPGALNRLGNNYYALTSESGPALIGAGLSGGRGSVEQKSLENSNVDVALEFTKLIIAQRGFQVNARAITTANDVLQELASIIR